MYKKLIFSLLVFAVCGCSAQPSERPMVSAVVEIPTLPEELVFAGERVPLENFDTRESLMREMLVYDEEQGYPEGGIAPGTKWEDVPEDFECPLCSVGKDQFSEG